MSEGRSPSTGTASGVAVVRHRKFLSAPGRPPGVPSHQPAVDRFLARRPDATTFATIYLALGTLPLVAIVAPELAFHVSNVVPRGVPGRVFLRRAWFWVTVTMVLVGVAYARLRDGELPTGLPEHRTFAAVAVALGAPLAVATALTLVVEGLLGTAIEDAAHIVYIPRAPPSFFLRNAVAPGVIIGVAYGVLFYGAIQDHLRERFGPTVAVSAVATLAGLYHWFVDPVATTGRSSLLPLVVLVLVVATGYATVLLSRIADAPSLTAALNPARIAVFALAGLLAFGVAVDLLSGATTAAELLVAVAWFAALTLAAELQERTRSLWIPTATVAAFQTAYLLTPYLGPAIGLGAPR